MLVRIFLLAVFAMLPLSAFAEASVVATVNVQDAVVEASEPGIFSARFVLSNRIGVQDNVLYHLEVRDKDGNTVDSVSRPEWRATLRSETPIVPVIEYPIPPFLPAGSYDAWVVATTPAELPLGILKLGSFEAVPSPSGVFIDPKECKIKTDGQEDSKLGDQADLSPARKSVVSCSMQNFSNSGISASVWYKVRRESSLGTTRESILNEPVRLKAGEQKIVDIDFPIEGVAGAYSWELALLDSIDRSKISNTIASRYSVNGFSGTITNAVLDRSSYRKGESARPGVLIELWGEIPEGKAILSAELLSNGVSCSDKIRREITKDSVSSNPFFSIDISVHSDCNAPVLSLELLDVSEKKLDGGKYGSDPSWPPTQAEGKPVFGNMARNFPALVVSVVFVIAILVIIIAIIRRRKNRLFFPVFLFLITSGFLFGPTPRVLADTLYLSGSQAPGGLSGSITASVTGNTVTVSGSATTRMANNEDERFFLDVDGVFGSRRVVDTYTTSGGYTGYCSAPRSPSYVTSGGITCDNVSSIFCGGYCSDSNDRIVIANASCGNISCSNGGTLQTCVNRPGGSSSRRSATHDFSTSFTTAISGSVGYHAAFDAPYDCIDDGSIHMGGAAQLSGSLPYTVVPPSPRPTASVSVTPTNVSYGGAVNVSFSSSGSPTACYIRNSTDGLGYQNPGVFSYTWYNIPLTQTTTWSVYCTGPGGTSDTVTATATVCPASTPNWNGSQCTGAVVPPSYSCTGSLPSGAEIYFGDDSGLSSNVAYNYSSWDSSYKCEFHCGAGLSWNGSFCESYVPSPWVDIWASPVVTNPGDRVSISWSSNEVSTCSASASPFDANWTGSKDRDSFFSPVSVWPSVTTMYSLTCNGMYGQVSDSQVITVRTPSFVVCPTNPTVEVGRTQQMTSYYKASGSAVTCSNNSGSSVVTGSTTWTSSTPARATVNASGIVSGVSVGTSQITGTYSGRTNSTIVTVTPPPCSSNCSSKAGDHCQGESFTTTNSCGNTETCTGTRHCDFNWKEVAPQ